MYRNQILRGILVSIVSLMGAGLLLAQEVSDLPGDQLATQALGRPYWHVFIAYAIAIGLIFFWVVVIGRRLLKIENKIRN